MASLPHDAMLSRKLKQLECRLHQMFHPPPTRDLATPVAAETDVVPLTTTTSLSDDIPRTFEFLKNLLLAEMDSYSGNKPDHLYHIADRLAFLEDTYHNWGKFGTPPVEEALETMSVCSCTYSCFNQGDDNDEEEWTEPPHLESKPTETEAPPVPVSPRVEEDEEETNEGREMPSTHRKVVWTIGASVALVAAAAAVALAITNLLEGEQEIPLVPT